MEAEGRVWGVGDGMWGGWGGGGGMCGGVGGGMCGEVGGGGSLGERWWRRRWPLSWVILKGPEQINQGKEVKIDGVK